MVGPVGELPIAPSDSWSSDEIPEIGSQPSFTPKRIIISRASQKVGWRTR